MLCVNVQGFKRNCLPASSGVAKVAFFDPSDFNFTQAAPIADVVQPYTAVALRDGATAETGALMYLVEFEPQQAEYKVTRATGKYASYEHELDAQLLGVNMNLTNFLMALDAASYCCGVGVIVWLYNGKLQVFGEKYVNDEEIAPFLVINDTTNTTTGKAFNDFAGANLVLKGTYSRPPIEYTGTWDSIVALMTVPAEGGD